MRIPDFRSIHLADQKALGATGAHRLLDAGAGYNLRHVLRDGGGIMFPHASLITCGHMIAAAVHACLDSGADRILALGVLHALTPELREARMSAAEGVDIHTISLRGIQGGDIGRGEEWKNEFSLLHFLFLLECECARRGMSIDLVTRYPFMSCGDPSSLPGMKELENIARDAVIVATADHVHHGIGYGNSPETCHSTGSDGEYFARTSIETGMELLGRGDYPAFERHCRNARSDAGDSGSVLRHLIGPFHANVIDVLCDDMSGPYNCPQPTWVAAGLVTAERETGE